MKRMVSRKSHSWWWDSHISRKNSKWLEENLQKMDQSVKQMLKLIEEEGESFAKKAEMYYQRRPQLISQVEDFYRMYRALAERYDQVTGDLRKNVQSGLKSQGSGNGSNLVSVLWDPPSPSSARSTEFTPESKPPRTIQTSRAAGFDFFLGSGGSSDLSRKGSECSNSSSSESDAESEFDDSNEADGDAVSSTLQKRVGELEDELHELREKLAAQEKSCHDHCKSKILALEEEILAANEKIGTAETGIVTLKKEIADTSIFLENKNMELSSEKKAASDLAEQTNMLQNAILNHRHELEVLESAAEAAAKQFHTELLTRDSKIEECEKELVTEKEKFLQEKSSLEAQITELEGVNMGLKAEVLRLQQGKVLLESRLSDLEIMIQELKASTCSTEDILREKSVVEFELVVLRGQVRQFEADMIQECEEIRKQFALNENFDALGVIVDRLKADKDALTADVVNLTNDVKSRDDKIAQMDRHLHQLHLEHVRLIKEVEEARIAGSNLKSRMKELEEEVDRQKIEISDGAEGKREAIRQLCFSIEHYRGGYQQLRQLLQGHKRSFISAN